MYQNLKKGLAGKIKSHFKNALHAMLVVTLDSESGQSWTVSLQTHINTPVILTMKAMF